LQKNGTVHQIFIDFKKAYDSVRTEVFCNIILEFGVPMDLVRLIQMCLIEMHSRIRTGKHLFDSFPIRNGLKQDDLQPLISNFVLEYAFRKVQEKQVGLKLYRTLQLLAYADDMNLLGDNMTRNRNFNSIQ
jgi:hypothetical protein